MIFLYDSSYHPPAPFVEVVFHSADGRSVGPLHAMVDSGADGTIVPLNHLRAIQADPTDERWLRSQWGERRHILLYLVDVQIGAVTHRGRDRGSW